MSQRTKREIKRAYKRLLLSQPLNKITVSNIADECGINRMTFYYHFKDIYELVEWSCVHDIAKVLSGKKHTESWQEEYLQVFRAFQDNKDFVLKLNNSDLRGYIEKLLHEFTYSLIMNVVEKHSVGMQVKDEDKQFLANFFKYAFCGVLADWISGEMEKDPEQIITQLSIVVEGDVKKALAKFRLDQSNQE
jgi:Transcriptional regulator